jgi:hypothetical protein
MELLMETIETKVAKVSKMHEYIEKRMAELNSIEVAEFAKRRRQYYSASSKRKAYLDKLKEQFEESQKTAKANAKNNGLTFIFAILVSFVIHYFELLDRNNQIIVFIGLAAYAVIKEISSHLDLNNYVINRARYNEQVDYYTHEMSCSGGGYVNYEDEYYKSSNEDDDELQEVVRNLYFASVDIAILNGMKASATNY